MRATEEMREVLAKEVECFGGGIEEMLKAANQRYFGMNNKASPEQKEEQIGDLINMMVVSGVSLSWYRLVG